VVYSNGIRDGDVTIFRYEEGGKNLASGSGEWKKILSLSPITLSSFDSKTVTGTRLSNDII
jgi:hypothetical protein